MYGLLSNGCIFLILKPITVLRFATVNLYFSTISYKYYSNMLKKN